MFDQIVWWCETAIEGLLLARSVQGKFYRKYPVFYLYLASVLIIEVVSFSVFSVHQSFYPIFYWYTQVFSVLFGYAVIAEIYRRALVDYPAVARLANAMVLSVFLVIVTRFVVNRIVSPLWWPVATWPQLERNLRTAQAILVMVIVGLLAYYAIPVGRNLKGIIFGYGFYVCASVMSLAFGSDPGYVVRPEWRYVQPLAYLAVLSIWCTTLWSYHPNPKPNTASRIERDYELLAQETMRLLSRARSYLIGAIRP